MLRKEYKKKRNRGKSELSLFNREESETLSGFVTFQNISFVEV